MSKTAEQAWRDYCKKWVDCNPEGASLMAISDFKQALRQSIEKDMNDLEVSTNDYWHGYKHGLRTVLERLDTVTPTKE